MFVSLAFLAAAQQIVIPLGPTPRQIEKAIDERVGDLRHHRLRRTCRRRRGVALSGCCIRRRRNLHVIVAGVNGERLANRLRPFIDGGQLPLLVRNLLIDERDRCSVRRCAARRERRDERLQPVAENLVETDAHLKVLRAFG